MPASSSPSPSPSMSISSSPSTSASGSLSASPSSSASPSGDSASPTASLSSSPSPSSFNHNADNDVILYLRTDIPSNDVDDRNIYAPRAYATISGTLYTGTFGAVGSNLLEAVASISARFIPPLVINGLLRAYAKIYPAGGQVTVPALIITYYRNGSVCWSKIGDTRILVDESNEAGYMPLPGDITKLVYGILELKKRLPIVYSGAGIFLLNPVSSPFATFGLTQLHELGVANFGAMCGGYDQHWFVDADYNLCTLEVKTDLNRPTVKTLGYQEFMRILSPNSQQIVMHYDRLNERVYISSTRGGYILTDKGLGGGYSRLTAADDPWFVSPATISAPTQLLVTDTFDFKERGIKTIFVVTLGTDAAQDLFVAVDYRYDKKAAFQTSPWIRCNKEGVVFPRVAGVEFRIRVKNNTYDDFELDYISIKHKFTDKRYFRKQSGQETV